MTPMSRLFLMSTASLVLAACASAPPSDLNYGEGKHLVYRDTAGNLIRQFDYPTEDACRRVAAIAGGARCQTASASTQLQAKATLRYNPPGFTVQGHYADVARCQSETRSLGNGVELVDGCTPK
jgi:hypothetical protein